MLSRFAALALVITATGCSGPTLSAPPAKTPASTDEPTATKSAAASIGTFTSDAAGFDTHSFWLDTGREVVVFDAQFTPALAEQVIAEIRAKTDSPIKYLVVTHPNPDKFNGATAFQKVGAKVVASARTAKAIPGVHAYKKYFFVNMAKMFTEETYPTKATVDVTFEGDLELPLEGDVKVQLHELSHRGVSSSQTVAYVPILRALFVGDLVHHHAHAWLEGGIVEGKASPDLEAWKQALGELAAYEGATVYGGRGEPAAVADAVKAQRAYLEAMEALVAKYVADLGAKKAELAGPKAAEHHKKIAALASEKFPDYALPYMVEYGAYGLLNQAAQ